MKFIVSSLVLLKNLQNINGVSKVNPIVPILENFLFRIEGGELNVKIQNRESLNLNEEGVTAVLLLNELRRAPQIDDIDELILEIYKDNKKIHSTHHYDFERIVRKIFIGLGYNVTPKKKLEMADMIWLQYKKA